MQATSPWNRRDYQDQRGARFQQGPVLHQEPPQFQPPQEYSRPRHHHHQNQQQQGSRYREPQRRSPTPIAYGTGRYDLEGIQFRAPPPIPAPINNNKQTAAIRPHYPPRPPQTKQPEGSYPDSHERRIPAEAGYNQPQDPEYPFSERGRTNQNLHPYQYEPQPPIEVRQSEDWHRHSQPIESAERRPIQQIQQIRPFFRNNNNNNNNNLYKNNLNTNQPIYLRDYEEVLNPQLGNPSPHLLEEIQTNRIARDVNMITEQQTPPNYLPYYPWECIFYSRPTPRQTPKERFPTPIGHFLRPVLFGDKSGKRLDDVLGDLRLMKNIKKNHTTNQNFKNLRLNREQGPDDAGKKKRRNKN